MKKLVALLLAVMMLSMSAMALAEVPEGYPAIVEEMIQSEHKVITIYDYWSGEGNRADEPTEEQQAQYDYQDWIEATYNVKIQQKQGGDWNTCAEEMANFTAAPDDSLRAYIIEPGKVGNLINGGIAAPIVYDFSAEKWNKTMIDMWTVNGNAYALATGKTDPQVWYTSTSVCWRKPASTGTPSMTCRLPAPGPGMPGKKCSRRPPATSITMA